MLAAEQGKVTCSPTVSNLLFPPRDAPEHGTIEADIVHPADSRIFLGLPFSMMKTADDREQIGGEWIAAITKLLLIGFAISPGHCS